MLAFRDEIFIAWRDRPTAERALAVIHRYRERLGAGEGHAVVQATKQFAEGALARHPGHLRVMMELTELCHDAKLPDLAAKALARAAQLAPSSAQVLHLQQAAGGSTFPMDEESSEGRTIVRPPAAERAARQMLAGPQMRPTIKMKPVRPEESPSPSPSPRPAAGQPSSPPPAAGQPSSPPPAVGQPPSPPPAARQATSQGMQGDAMPSPPPPPPAPRPPTRQEVTARMETLPKPADFDAPVPVPESASEDEDDETRVIAAQNVPVGAAHAPRPRHELVAIRSTAPTLPRAAKPEPIRRSKGPLVIIGAVVVVAASVAVAFFFSAEPPAGVELSADAHADLRAKLMRGDPASLNEVEQTLMQGGVQTSADSQFAELWVHERVVRVLEHDPGASGLESAMSRATSAGASANRLLAGEILRCVMRNDSAALEAALKQLDNYKAASVFALYAAGVALERNNDPRAKEYFEQALEKEPGMRLAQLHLLRNEVLGGSKAIEEKLSKLSEQDASDELLVLSATLSAERKGFGKPLAAFDMDAEQLPRVVRPLALALKAAGADDAEQTGLFAQAIAEADDPLTLRFVAERATAAGSGANALVAAEAAVEAGMTDERMLGVFLDSALVSGNLAALSAPPATLPPADRAALQFLAAYELGAVPEGAAPTDKRFDIPLRRRILAGVEPLPGADLAAPSKRPTVAARLLAADAHLDAGRLDEADAVLAGVAEAGAVRHRMARLQRYRDPSVALPLPPARATDGNYAFQLLLGYDGGDRERLKELKDLAVTLDGVRRPFALAYVKAMAGDIRGARDALSVPPPGPEAPLSVRLAALRAYAALRDFVVGRPMAMEMVKSWGVNPDVIWAAERLGVPVPKRAL